MNQSCAYAIWSAMHGAKEPTETLRVTSTGRTQPGLTSQTTRPRDCTMHHPCHGCFTMRQPSHLSCKRVSDREAALRHRTAWERTLEYCPQGARSDPCLCRRGISKPDGVARSQCAQGAAPTNCLHAERQSGSSFCLSLPTDTNVARIPRVDNLESHCNRIRRASPSFLQLSGPNPHKVNPKSLVLRPPGIRQCAFEGQRNAHM